MTITLYKNHSEPEKIGKDLRSSTPYTGTLREQTDIIKPSVLLEVSNPSEFNYMYIPDFNRYYFITSMVSVRKNLWRINGTVDVLESFKTAIKANRVILSDSEVNGANEYLAGRQWRSLVKTKTNIIQFSSGLLNNGEYILITAGG